MKKISALAVAGVFVVSLAGTALAEGTDVKVSGEIRIRDQWTNNKDWNADAGDVKNAITQRTRVNVDAKINEKTSAYVSLENNRIWGSSGPTFTNGVTTTSTGTTVNSVTADTDLVGIYQAYVVLDKLFDQPLLFKAGRTKVALGNQRLVGANDWLAGQSFDSLILGYNIDAVSVTGFSVTGVDRNSTTSSENGTLNGLYVTIKAVPVTGIDVYAIQKKELAGAATTGQNFFTYGARVNGAVMNIDWDVEGALQSGDSSVAGTTTTKKSASAIWAIAGYSLPEVAKLRIGAEYDILSGQKSTGTDDTAFDHLFLTKHSTSAQHSVYGVTDYVETLGAIGLKALSINVSAEPVEGLKLLAEYWTFDSNTGTDDKTLGNEINVQAWYAVTKNTGLHAYYAMFTPTSDLANFVAGATGAKKDAATDLVLQLQVAF
ncbi:MAG: putative outer membrane protein [Deltaproteobacteria bacterium]|nr:putative outer membrane protein [Deltaproteobacteria bacterium]